jgi:non-heme chloroperoxidase
LKTYKDLPHGCCQTHPEMINPEILSFIQRDEATAARQPAEATPVLA